MGQFVDWGAWRFQGRGEGTLALTRGNGNQFNANAQVKLTELNVSQDNKLIWTEPELEVELRAFPRKLVDERLQLGLCLAHVFLVVAIECFPQQLLVTDDALIIRELIKDAAVDRGWEIAGEASNGQEAVEQFDELRPDAVTLDMVMPEFDGLHALEGTNNTAELNALHQAMLIATEKLKDKKKVQILSDSTYSIKAMTVWGPN